MREGNPLTRLPRRRNSMLSTKARPESLTILLTGRVEQDLPLTFLSLATVKVTGVTSRTRYF